MVANIFISFIGAGVLGLPYAFKEAGLMEGTLIMSGVCYLSVKAMLLLIDCKYRLESSLPANGMASPVIGTPPGSPPPPSTKAKTASAKKKGKVSQGKEYIELRDLDVIQPSPSIGRTITYSDVGFAAFGTTGRLTIDTTLLVSQIGFCCAYLIFISENLASFIHGLAQHQWLMILLPPLFFLTLIPDLSNLAIFSLIAQISNLFAFAVVFWFDFDHLHLASPEHRKEFSLAGFPFFFSIAIYCFEGAGMILSLEHATAASLRPKFKQYFVWTIVSVTTLYISFGLSGYLSYGRETKDIITLNLPHDDNGLDFAVIVKACLCFSLFFTYPIMLFPVTTLLEERFLNKTSSSLYSHGLRFGLVSLTGVIVVLVPQFSDLMALVGATCCTLLAFIMPGACHLALFKRSLDQSDVILDYTLVIVGIVGAIVGTLDAISNISS